MIPNAIRNTAQASLPTSISAITTIPAGTATRMRAPRSDRGPRRRGGCGARWIGPLGSARRGRSRAGGRRGRSRGAGRRGWRRRLSRGTSPPSEPPPARGVLLEALLIGRAREVRPQLIAEDELRVVTLPEQEIRTAPLTAGADDQV